MIHGTRTFTFEGHAFGPLDLGGAAGVASAAWASGSRVALEAAPTIARGSLAGSRPLSRLRRLLKGTRARVVVTAVIATVVAGIGASTAHAALPYHTNPTAAFVTYDASHTGCWFSFNNPSTVLSYTVDSSYVWWRPLGAVVINGEWRYSYGEWRRALATSSRMVTWWESLQMFGYNVASGANQIAGSYRPHIDNVWLGYQLWYASKGGDAVTLWLYQSGC